MKLTRLQIQQLPGLSEGFVFEGLREAGVNLVTAPNAFGKSSLIRALVYLLSDAKRNDPPISLTADFTDGEASWQVSRTGSDISWQRSGQPASRPPLPQADELGRYWLSMENLVAANPHDENLAAELMRDLRGGFDLGEARLKIKNQHGRHEERALRDANGKLRGAEQSAKNLSKEQDRLPEIEADLKKARHAEILCEQLETAKRLAETVSQRKSVEAELKMFPERMEALSGIDPKALETLATRLDTSRADIRSQEQGRIEAESTLKALGLSSDDLAPAETALKAALGKLKNLQSAHETKNRHEQEAARETIRVREASNALGGVEQPKLNHEHLRSAEGFAASLLKLQAERDALATKIKLAGEPPDEETIKQHERGIDALREWLVAQAPPMPPRPINWLLAFSFAAAIASVGAYALHPLIAGACVAASSIGIGLAWWRLRSSVRGQRNPERQEAEKSFNKTGLEAPVWDTEQVRASLKAFNTALAKLIAARSRSEGADELRARLTTVEEALEAKATERDKLAESIGFDPAMPVTEIDRFIRLTKDWEEAELSLAQCNEAIKQSQARMEEAVNDISRLLGPWDVPVSNDLETLDAEMKAFQQRLNSARQAAQALDQANQALKRLTSEVRAHESDRAALFERAGIDNEDEVELSRRLQLREAWLETRTQLEAAKVRGEQHLKALEGAPELIELASAVDTEELDTRLEYHRNTAERLEPLIDERSRISAAIEQAEDDSRVQATIAEVATSRTDLERKRDELLLAEATDLLLDDVETTYTTGHQPEVLQEADRLFRQVTAHEFGLALSEQGRFEADDLRQHKRRALGELSTGTRMQLLLSVRMAWLRHRSQGALMLPVFLDEALTTSDEQRFMEVARTVHTLASSTGTQIVYLSARRSEVSLWKAAIGDALNCIDLEEQRIGARAERQPEFAVVPPREIPRPKPKDSAEVYAQTLAVPPIDPQSEAGEIHVFHLLRDNLEGVHRLLDLHRIDSLGQLESLLAQSPESIGDSDLRARLANRCRAAHAWVSAWRQGRGRPLDTPDLEASGIVTDTFLPDVRRLLISPEVNGDARQLLHALKRGEVKRVRTKMLDELEDWLRRKRYVDDDPRLSSQERHQYVLRSFGAEDDAVLRDVGRCLDWLEAGAS